MVTDMGHVPNEQRVHPVERIRNDFNNVIQSYDAVSDLGHVLNEVTGKTKQQKSTSVLIHIIHPLTTMSHLGHVPNKEQVYTTKINGRFFWFIPS